MKSPAATRALAIVGATVGAILVWVIAHQAVGDLNVKTGDSSQTVSIVAVILTVVFAGLIGWGLLAILERATGKARTIWTVVAVVFLVLSLLGPLGAVGTGAKVSLLLMHLVAGAVIIPLFARSTTPR
ncbi:hypothetical protein Dvina_31175 [Dactylosporangium vinaceum]|uniref:DUF6069 family protein n=1 Tax=Dactylosporangium vinaceum TaxID=53362 RepID=A0ABV5MK71_9ACTN|nr:DUF6069 family protein [Dactylosporangium vinaceum]UAB92778.1 hypothetical protein Dvina_31175 [Dactylosporangium vinaceum]